MAGVKCKFGHHRDKLCIKVCEAFGHLPGCHPAVEVFIKIVVTMLHTPRCLMH